MLILKAFLGLLEIFNVNCLFITIPVSREAFLRQNYIDHIADSFLKAGIGLECGAVILYPLERFTVKPYFNDLFHTGTPEASIAGLTPLCKGGASRCS